MGKRVGANLEYQRWFDGAHSKYLSNADEELNKVITDLEKAGADSEAIAKLKEISQKVNRSNNVMLKQSKK